VAPAKRTRKIYVSVCPWGYVWVSVWVYLYVGSRQDHNVNTHLSVLLSVCLPVCLSVCRSRKCVCVHSYVTVCAAKWYIIRSVLDTNLLSCHTHTDSSLASLGWSGEGGRQYSTYVVYPKMAFAGRARVRLACPPFCPFTHVCVCTRDRLCLSVCLSVSRSVRLRN